MRSSFLTIIWLAVAAISVVMCGAVRQTQSSVPYGDIGPTFDISDVQFIYPTAYRALRSIEFHDFVIHLGGDPKGVRLKDGKYIERDLTYQETDLKEVHYLTPTNSPVEYALLLLDDLSAGGSSSEALVAQVLELSNQKLRVVQEISADEHYGGPFFPHPFNEATQTLVMHSAHYQKGDAHCCVSAMDVITYKWNGSRFIQTSIDTDLTDNGKREAKRLGP
jgi:hypothetical protein